MKYLLDTCVISEIFRPLPDENVISWIQDKNENSLYLSVLTFGEIEKGIEKSLDSVRKRKLQLWVEQDNADFIAAYNQSVTTEGLPLGSWQMF